MKEKIMIIEDNRTIRGELCVFFEKNEFTPVETGDFTTVEQVVAAVRKVEPKLILLDINLEEISGFDVCREIRKWSGTPILFVTARERDVDELCAMECGGDDYIENRTALQFFLPKSNVCYKEQTVWQKKLWWEKCICILCRHRSAIGNRCWNYPKMS